jgi:hypothetical protein
MLKIREKHIEKAVCDILELDGWRCFKMEQNFSERKMKMVGEAGMPDRLFMRYDWNPATRYAPVEIVGRSVSEVMWVEFKAKGGKPSLVQTLWHSAERRRGALTLIAGIDFPASFDGFMEWYRDSGLMRKRM